MTTTTTRPTASPARTIFPMTWSDSAFYQPTGEGAEAELKERLERWTALRHQRQAVDDGDQGSEKLMSAVEQRAVAADEADIASRSLVPPPFPEPRPWPPAKASAYRSGAGGRQARPGQCPARRRPDHPYPAARRQPTSAKTTTRSAASTQDADDLRGNDPA